MAPIWSMISTKGGCGKTTTAIILASELVHLGKRVTMIDADPNCALKLWKARSIEEDGSSRLPDNLKIIVDEERNGDNLISIMKKEKYNCDLIIIDTEGTNNRASTFAAAYSNLCIIPATSGAQDATEALRSYQFVKSAADMKEVIIPSIIIRSRAPSAILTVTEKDVQKTLKDSGVVICKVPIYDRSAFSACFTFGCTLYDLPKYAKMSGLDKSKKNSNDFLSALAIAAYEFKKMEMTNV